MEPDPAYTGLRDGYVLQPLPPEKELNPKDIDWRIEALIGRGNFGQVVRGTWRGKPCALKVANPNNGQEALDLLKEEASKMARMNHPNIVWVHGCATKNEHFVMVMEMLHQSLQDLLERLQEQHDLKADLDSGAVTVDILPLKRKSLLKSPLENVPIWHILRDVVRGLQYLHKQKLIHRDVKPSNILLSRDFNAKLCDFGLVREVDPAGNMTNAGSTAYKAPEVIYGSGTYDTAADIFSLGRVIEKDILPVLPSKALRDLANYCLKPLPGATEGRYAEPKDRPTATNLLKRIDAMIKKHEAWWKPRVPAVPAYQSVAFTRRTTGLPNGNHAPSDEANPVNSEDAPVELPRSQSVPLPTTLLHGKVRTRAAKRAALGVPAGAPAPKRQATVILKSQVDAEPKPVRVRKSRAKPRDSGENNSNRSRPLVPVPPAPRTAKNSQPAIRVRLPKESRDNSRDNSRGSRSDSTTVAESSQSSLSDPVQVRTAALLLRASQQVTPEEDFIVYISPMGRGTFYHATSDHKGATRELLFSKAIRVGFKPCPCAHNLKLPAAVRPLLQKLLNRAPRTRARARKDPMYIEPYGASKPRKPSKPKKESSNDMDVDENPIVEEEAAQDNGEMDVDSNSVPTTRHRRSRSASGSYDAEDEEEEVEEYEEYDEEAEEEGEYDENGEEEEEAAEYEEEEEQGEYEYDDENGYEEEENVGEVEEWQEEDEEQEAQEYENEEEEEEEGQEEEGVPEYEEYEEEEQPEEGVYEDAEAEEEPNTLEIEESPKKRGRATRATTAPAAVPRRRR